jgi:hypothetical protein
MDATLAYLYPALVIWLLKASSRSVASGTLKTLPSWSDHVLYTPQRVKPPKGGTGPNRSHTDWVLSSMRSRQTCAFALVTRSF